MPRWTYFHDLDPFIIQFTENIGIRWYSMAYIVGFFISYLLVKHFLTRTKTTPLSKENLADIVVWAAFGLIIGGRVGYALFYDSSLFSTFDSRFPYWELLKIYHGGLASHGAIIGLILGVIFFARKRNFPVYHCLDIIGFGAGIGIFLGRLANFVNGELYGRVITGNPFIAVQFPQEMMLWVAEKKTEYLKDITEAVVALKDKIDLTGDQWQNLIYQFESTGQGRGQIYFVIQSLLKACEEGNKAVIQSLKEVISYRYPSQIYQAVLEGLLPFLIVWFFWRKKARKPGVIAGLWAISYAVMRIVGEQFRLPDAQLGFRALGLTRGQWLSVTMLVLVCIYFVLVFRNKSSQKFGGWNSRS